jgi:hypothetical protein
MTKLWSTNAADYLVRLDLCPRCDAILTQPGLCWSCRAELSATATAELDAASDAAAAAILDRQALIDALPTRAAEPVAPPVKVAVATTTAATPAREGSQVSVQSVLAVVGAALLAVAAIVFTFFNPDLTDFGVRTAIVAVTTAVFLGGALLLNHAKLRFSAEAVGALGIVFVALDIYAFSHGASPTLSPFVFVGIGTFGGAAAMIAVASLVRIRTWLWLGLLGLATTPAWFGYALGTMWWAIVGHLAVGFVALGVYELARRLRSRFGSPLRAERVLATVLGVAVAAIVVIQFFWTLDQPSAPRIAAALVALAVLAALAARNQIPTFWSVLVGAFFVSAATILSLWKEPSDGSWLFAISPAAAVVGLIILALLLRPMRLLPRLKRPVALIAALTVVGVATVPSLFVSVGNEAFTFFPDQTERLSSTLGLASALGLLVVAAGLVALRFLSRSPAYRVAGIIAIWLGMAAIVDIVAWSALSRLEQVVTAEGAALVLGLLLVFVLNRRGVGLQARLPLILGAHVILILGTGLAWYGSTLSIVGGIGAILVLGVLAFTIPRTLRPFYTAAGFAYALLIFWHGMNLTHVHTLAALSLTASLGSIVGLAATVVRRVPIRHWYAILGVTVVPFLIGVITVLFVRSGWTALSTGVMCALALTLLVTRRPGLSRYLRAIAATLLVPALAVVVISLGAQVITVSASPITLPIIAFIIACTVASTGLIRGGLVAHGFSAEDASLIRFWIEISCLVTAVFAELLAIVRSAAGLDTSFLVLVILGIGAAAAAFTTRRRYAWSLAAASWTGALWSAWGILGIQAIEPYLLPPAIGAALVGAIFVVRKSPGLGLYSVGLACGILPSLAVLAIWGNGGSTPWRTIGLLGGAVVLVVFGAIMSRRPAGSGFGNLATPTLSAGIVAAAAGAVQAVRIAWGLDHDWTSSVMITALVLCGSACIVAALGARFLVTRARVTQSRWRWVYMPAVLYLVVGPVAAMRPGWFSIWTLWILTLVLLGIMVAVALRAQRHPVALPPAWFMIAVAWCTAVTGWSDRELRVEAFSLPLGLALLAVGIIGMRKQPLESPRTLNSWPMGFTGSWPLLAPGIILTLLPSIIATGTDPQTLRAVLVISLSLIAILIGSLRKYGAPFILGIAALPIENIVVFAVQAGHHINATSWWITLASAGAVLLVIAVTYERRTSGERGIAARMRDLR